MPPPAIIMAPTYDDAITRQFMAFSFEYCVYLLVLTKKNRT